MKIGILGGKGFLGSNLVKEFSKMGHDVVAIDIDNYFKELKHEYDLLINANGNSKKYIAEQDPLLDFNANVTSVYESLYLFNFKRYIYISSIDIYFPIDVYSQHKQIAEDVVDLYSKRTGKPVTKFRCGTIIGPNMKKGILYDILYCVPLRTSLDSYFQFITPKAIAEFAMQLIDKPEWESFYDLFSPDNISVSDLIKMVNPYRTFFGGIKYQFYNVSPNTNLKSCLEYIKETLKEC